MTAITPANFSLQKLFREMEHRGDLPAISESVWRIVAVMDRENEDFDLTQAILDDAVLTQKVLRESNSAVYSRFNSAGISTVSHAVVILGYNRIGHMALALKLANELLQAASHSKHVRVKNALNECAITGTLARHISRKLNPMGSEAAAVSCMMRGVARIILMSYLPDVWTQVENLLHEEPAKYTESSALHKLIGMTLGSFSQAVAKYWRLPEKLTASLADLDPAHISSLGTARSHSEWLGLLAHHCHRLRRTLDSFHYRLTPSRALSLSQEYSAAFGLSSEDFLGGVANALREERANPLIRSAETPRSAQGEKLPDAQHQLSLLCSTLRQDARKHSNRSLMGMVMESMMRIFGPRRVLVMRFDSKQNRLVTQMGQGHNAANFLGRLTLEPDYTPDAFHLAIAQNTPVLIQDSRALQQTGKLPKEYTALVKDSPPFLLLPIIVGSSPEALLYLDWDPAGPVPTLTPAERNHLAELRDVLVEVLEVRRALKVPD